LLIRQFWDCPRIKSPAMYFIQKDMTILCW